MRGNEDLQVILACILMPMIFAGAGLALYYIKTLTHFFAELAKKEPDVWDKIGQPTLLNMLFMPFHNFRKYYAFLGDLKARRNDSRYTYAGRAYFLLKAGLLYCLALFIVTLMLGLSL